ncbi:hypothetical protein LTR27_004524 [Elasticomyces elasticus]|nr:hypothetical protein LTR27_004524 [Elasticomyces elasticus]
MDVDAKGIRSGTGPGSHWSGDVSFSLESSRWFKRGWTLQELIAPFQLKLYDKHWTLFADRHTWASRLSNITGIPQQVLDWPNYEVEEDSLAGAHPPRLYSLRKRLQQYTVAQRMSWAANRQTSRREDIAYSLLGIFDVNMPLLYGEGSRAFFRLQEEIIRRSTDNSILAWTYASDCEAHEDSDDHDDELLAGRPSCFELDLDTFPVANLEESDLESVYIAGATRDAKSRRQDIASVPHWATRPDSECELTNEGLRMRAPLVRNFQGSDWAVLDCGLQRDLIGPLAMRLIDHIPGSLPRYRVAGVERLATVPLELVNTAAITSFMLLSHAKGGLYPDERRRLLNINFRVNIFNERRVVRVLGSSGQSSCNRALTEFQPSKETASANHANRAPQDVTVSIMGRRSVASGLRLKAANSRYDQASSTDVAGPSHTCNVAFHVYLDPREYAESPTSRYKCWVAIGPATEALQAFCSAMPTKLQNDRREATLTAQNMMVHVTISPCDAKTMYWQVDVRFSSIEPPSLADLPTRPGLSIASIPRKETQASWIPSATLSAPPSTEAESSPSSPSPTPRDRPNPGKTSVTQSSAFPTPRKDSHDSYLASGQDTFPSRTMSRGLGSSPQQDTYAAVADARHTQGRAKDSTRASRDSGLSNMISSDLLQAASPERRKPRSDQPILDIGRAQQEANMRSRQDPYEDDPIPVPRGDVPERLAGYIRHASPPAREQTHGETSDRLASTLPSKQFQTRRGPRPASRITRSPSESPPPAQQHTSAGRRIPSPPVVRPPRMQSSRSGIVYSNVRMHDDEDDAIEAARRGPHPGTSTTGRRRRREEEDHDRFSETRR